MHRTLCHSGFSKALLYCKCNKECVGSLYYLPRCPDWEFTLPNGQRHSFIRFAITVEFSFQEEFKTNLTGRQKRKEDGSFK